jgi:hypothetical protein
MKPPEFPAKPTTTSPAGQMKGPCSTAPGNVPTEDKDSATDTTTWAGFVLEMSTSPQMGMKLRK